MWNLGDDDYKDGSAICPLCDSDNLTYLGNGDYRCEDCGEEFNINDCETF